LLLVIGEEEEEKESQVLKSKVKGRSLMKWQCRYQESALRGRIALPYGLDQDDPATMKKWLLHLLSSVLKSSVFIAASQMR
jgi:hypothetical protein